MRAHSTGRPVPSPTRRRVAALIAAAVTVAAGLLVHRALPDSAASDIAGDALYALLIYALAVGVAPRARVGVVAAAAIGWCVAVELLQLTGIPERAGAVFPPAMLVLGTAFDPRDLAVYAVTVVAAAGADAAQRSIRSRFTARRPR
ncbi:DUF2809 domain-containing protein [Microbacterium sp. NM3R9]|uniref:ribosomal maturation YjgA family protein n=1 Tax=Microbacterium thalli TaxID=3027921 RepID=UPI002364FC54|nr:DUF2809 domain-containing protein [Microbacterium thalli]MDD7930627.1 DUF2809 domain-containing protein [Microbacterium thalli]MDN8550165.1 DUF2809 domain-containing protein [Microbacterium thalli]